MSQLDRTTSEKELSLMVRQLASLKGWKVYHTFYSMFSDAGFPDLCLCRGDRLVFMELKTEKGKVSQAQKEWLEALALTKCEVFVFRPSEWESIVEVLV